MRVKVLFFSRLRDIAGASEWTVELSDDAAVSELMEQIYGRAPALRSWDETILVGVGVEFVQRTHRLRAGDEVAIMPPVQGG